VEVDAPIQAGFVQPDAPPRVTNRIACDRPMRCPGGGKTYESKMVFCGMPSVSSATLFAVRPCEVAEWRNILCDAMMTTWSSMCRVCRACRVSCVSCVSCHNSPVGLSRTRERAVPVVEDRELIGERVQCRDYTHMID